MCRFGTLFYHVLSCSIMSYHLSFNIYLSSVLIIPIIVALPYLLVRQKEVMSEFSTASHHQWILRLATVHT